MQKFATEKLGFCKWWMKNVIIFLSDVMVVTISTASKRFFQTD